MVKISLSKNYSNVSLPAKLEKIYGMPKLVGLHLFWSRTPTFSSGTPTFCQMGVLNSCFQNPSESSELSSLRISKNELWISKNQFVFMDIHNSFLDIHKLIYGYPIFN